MEYWWWNADYDDTRWKEINVVLTITPVAPGPSTADIVVNYSTDLWAAQPGSDVNPPLPSLTPQEETDYIVRVMDPVVWSGAVAQVEEVTVRIVVPDYNPQWVSLDVRGTYVTIVGTMHHKCIPKPAW